MLSRLHTEHKKTTTEVCAILVEEDVDRKADKLYFGFVKILDNAGT
jgi:hypothetical protein